MVSLPSATEFGWIVALMVALAEPSNDAEPLRSPESPIVLDVASVVAVSALPVTSPVTLPVRSPVTSPVTLPVTLPVRGPTNPDAVVIPVMRTSPTTVNLESGKAVPIPSFVELDVDVSPI